MTEEIKRVLTCPISHDIMRDPVMIFQSGHTFDRELLCRWLLKNPTICPATNVDFGEKLQYGDNVSVRKLLLLCMGDEAYQKYNDSSFRKEYEDTLVVGSSLVEPDSSTLYNFGKKYIQEELNYERASHYFALAAAQGHVNAQYNLGVLYQEGKGVERDFEKARHYHELAANQGDAGAQYNLGIFYKKGYGVEQDYDKAKYYYERAEEHGHVGAQCSLGNLYHDGNGVEQDYKKAREYYERAANQGSANAHLRLGIIYARGYDVEQDYDTARHFLEQAAEQGLAIAQDYIRQMNQE